MVSSTGHKSKKQPSLGLKCFHVHRVSTVTTSQFMIAVLDTTAHKITHLWRLSVPLVFSSLCQPSKLARDAQAANFAKSSNWSSLRPVPEVTCVKKASQSLTTWWQSALMAMSAQRLRPLLKSMTLITFLTGYRHALTATGAPKALSHSFLIMVYLIPLNCAEMRLCARMNLIPPITYQPTIQGRWTNMVTSLVQEDIFAKME